MNILDRNKFKKKLRNICKDNDISYTVADEIIKALDKSMYPIIDISDNWMSVKEHLPPEKGTYLCYYRFEDTQGTPDVVCENTYLGSGHWQSDGNAVTHWMLAPPIPLEFVYEEMDE